jgi:membrane fusion protein, multidrug efflux system
MSVVNLTNLKVIGEVGESYAGKINKGDEVVLFFPDLKTEINTKVGFSSRMINSLNRTFNVEVPLSGEISSMSPNMIVVMKIVDYKNENAIIVPVDLLQRSADGNYVMAVTEGNGKMIAHRKPVQTGRTYNGQAEIISGITASDKIVVTGYRDLNEGQEIRTK